MLKSKYVGDAAASIAVLASTLVPLILYLRRFGLFAPYSMLAADSFYYLTVARNSLGLPFYSFDGLHPTNGFHPVWQLVLYSAMRLSILDPANIAVTLRRLFLGNLLILSLAHGLLAWVCARHLRRKWLSVPAVCPGFLWFIVGLSAPLYLAGWSYLNGMETSVELLFFGLALVVFSPDKSYQRLLISLCLFGMAVLSRLDDVFFLFPVLALVFKRTERPFRRWIAMAIPLMMIAAYLVYNHRTVGTWMPTSGVAKAGLALPGTLRAVGAMVLPVGEGWEDPAQYALFHFSWTSEVFMRVFQMIAPMVICSAFAWRRRASFGVLEALCVGVTLKALYNLCFVHLFYQGSWYYGISIFVANLVLAVTLDHFLSRVAGKPTTRVVPLALGTAFYVAFTFNIFINHVIDNVNAPWLAAVVQRRDAMRAMVEREHAAGFIEGNDGVLAYVTGMPVLSGQGLVLDPAAHEAIKAGHFFEFARGRGYTLIMASGFNRIGTDLVLSQQEKGMRPWLYAISPDEFDRFAVTPVEYDSESDTKLYRVTPR